MHFKGIITQYGPIPPGGGRARKRYMEVNGLRQLKLAEEEFLVAVGMLGEQSCGLPALFDPIECHDDDARQKIQQEARLAWKQFAFRLEPDQLTACEVHIRQSEAAAVASLNYLEDTTWANSAHQAIHRAAFMRSGLYGCPISYADGLLWTNCSVNLSHIRVGLSAGMTGDFICSICGQLLEDCDHIVAETYSVVAVKGSAGNCAICDLQDCEHEPGLTYRVTCSGVGANLVIHEASMVARPQYPLARFTDLAIHELDVRDPNFQHAVNGNLNCDACIGPCAGLNDAALWGGQQAATE